MRVNCPHCGKQLQMNAKVQETIQKLGAGQKLKVKCVHCGNPFGLDKENAQPKSAGKTRAVSSASSKAKDNLAPPPSPDISWLKDGVFDDQETVEDIPKALVLMPDIESKTAVVTSVGKFGYQVEQAATAEEAVNKMRFINYSAVFLHSRYESGAVESGLFHAYMRSMEMSRRRYIFYVLIGPEFKTLYDLEALTCSANIVVNDTEIPYIGTVLKKAIPEYELLFGPIMEEMRVAGK